MDIIKFIDDNRKYLNIRQIERDCEMANGLIGKIIKGDRELSSDKADVLIGLFGWIPIKFTHGAPVKNNSIKPTKKLPDLNKDGSFGDKWENYFKFFEHTSGVQYKYKKVDGKCYPTEEF